MNDPEVVQLSEMRSYYTYILCNPAKTTFYTGITNNLKRRISEHKSNRGKWKTFAGRYYCYKLVYYEIYDRPMKAIRREKEIKNMSSEEKERLILTMNPGMHFINIW